MKNKLPNRNRNFACVVYPDSAPAHWLDILKAQFVPAFVSPLHDKDINPDGETKKPHYHVIVMYEGVKTLDQWHEFRDKIGGVGDEIVQSKRGYARYLCHLDNPEKTRYNTEDVLEIAGADYKTACSRDSDKYGQIRAMINYIRNNHILSFCEFFNYCMDFEPEWYHALCDHSSYIIKNYLESKSKEEFYSRY